MPDLAIGIMDLWMPTLVSSVVVFVASFLAWMVMPHHKKDWVQLPNEDELLPHLKIAPGQYMFPFCATGADMKSDAFQAKWNSGPWGTLCVFKSKANMGQNMVATFIFYVIVSAWVAFLASSARLAGAERLDIFQFCAFAAVAAYALGGIPNAIWFQKTFRSTLNDVIDGIVYGVITGGVFAWLWPAANAPGA